MSIVHGTTPANLDKQPGHDLRDTVVGSRIRYGSPEAVAHFQEVLAEKAAQAAARKEKKAVNMNGTISLPVAEPVEAVPIVDDTASREFAAARKRPSDPAPVAIEQQPARGAAKRLTDEQARAAHAEYWSGGDSQRTVARRYGVTDSTLSARWKELGLPTKSKGRPKIARQKRALAVKPAAPPTAKAETPATALAPATPTPVGPATRPYSPDPEAFLPPTLLAQIRAFQDEMETLGIDVAVKFDLRLVKEVTL